MKEAVVELSSNAFKLLNLLYYDFIKESNLADDKAMAILGVSRKPYFKAKDELKEKGYIKIVQVGSTKYKWYIGKESIRKDNEKYKAKESKDRQKFAMLVLEGRTETNTEQEEKSNEVFVLEGFEQGFDNELSI